MWPENEDFKRNFSAAKHLSDEANVRALTQERLEALHELFGAVISDMHLRDERDRQRDVEIEEAERGR